MRLKKIEDIQTTISMSSCDMTLKYDIKFLLISLYKTSHIKSTYHKNLITISPKNTLKTNGNTKFGYYRY